MQLSSKARKAVAAGLTASTMLWASVLGFAPMAASAAVHTEGCLVLSGGVVWLITGGTRRGFTSAEVFASHGYNFSQVVSATSEDVALPVGPIMTYADGTLVMGPNDPLVYLVSNGQKRGFTTGSVFTGMGYSFANIQVAPVNTFSDLPTGSNIDTASMAHPAGTLVISGGAVWKMTATGRMGFPSAAVFNSYGHAWAKVVAANSFDLAMADQGAVSARPACSTTGDPVSGSVNVSLNGPAASTLVAGQANANLANFVFTGNGTVTSVVLKRIGVSADSTLSNVYLFNGATRLTDAATVSSGNVSFSNSSGLFAVNGSTTISVLSDIATGTSGQTVGVQLTGATLASGSVGGLGVSGNIHTVASATLATVALGTALPSSSTTTDPQNDVRVWENTFTVGVRDVTFSRMALRQINSIQSGDIRNFRLLVDGVQVASQQNLDANGYVTFSGFSKVLASGGRNVKVLADVIGGSSRIIQMSLRNKADLGLMDSQYGVDIAASGTIPSTTATITVNSGTMTVEKATGSASGNITKDASGVSLGKFTFTAFGEPIKVETLNVGIDTSLTDDDVTLRNGKVMVNGSQVGSTTGLVADASFSPNTTSFTTNFVVNPGSPATVEVVADIFDEEGTNDIVDAATIQVALTTGSSNATRQVSLGTINVPGANVTGNTLTVDVGSMSLAQQTNYANQTVVVPQTAYKLAAMNLTGNSTEDVNVHTIAVDFTSVTNATFAAADLTNVYIKYGSQTSTIKSTVAATGESWSVSFVLPKNSVVPVEIYATIGSSITSGDSIKTTTTVTGTTAQSSTSVNTGAVDGQTIAAGAGSITATKDASSPIAAKVYDNQTVDAAAFKFASVNDGYTLTEVVVTIANATTVQNVMLMDGGTTLQTKPGATTVTFTGLSIPVSSNSNKVLKVSLQLGTVGVGAGTSGSSALVTLTSGKAIAASSGTEDAITESDPAANALYVYAAVPTVANVDLPTSVLGAGTKTIAKFTVTSNGGTVSWKQVLLDISKSAAPTIASPTLWDVTGGANTQITAATAFQNGSAGVATTCVADNTVCELLISVGTNADDNVEEQVSGTKTYEVRATIGGTLAANNNISTQIASNLAHVASAAYTGVDNDTTVDDATFVWSDMSAQSHDTGTTDWTSENLIRVLPTPTWTLTHP